jgi:hypothetical protein
MKEKMTIILGIIITTLVVSTFAYYIINDESVDLFDLISIPLLIVIILYSSYIIHDKLKNLKAGLPSKDERLLTASYKAGYYGFVAAIWSAVCVNLGYSILFDKELRGGLVTAAVVLISGFVFAVSYLYFSRKGN